MPEQAVEFVILGITLDGKPFRPSDWAERLCGVMSAFGGDRRKDNEFQVRDGRVTERTKLAELQGVTSDS